MLTIGDIWDDEEGNIISKNKLSHIFLLIPKRKITVYNTNLISLNNETVEFDITVSKGTYIRSIVDDMGQYLDTKAIVKELNRTAVGNLKSTNKNLITNVENLKSLDPVPVLNWSEVLDLPSVVLDINQENHIRNGQLLENKYFKTSNKHLIIICISNRLFFS